MPLDPDDPRPPYQQVAQELRAAILTRTLAPGDKLPTGAELAKRYAVARMTIQQAIRLLRAEGLIVSRQGSGVYVRARTEQPVGLRPHLERAFESDEVTIDFAGFSAETLANSLAEPLDKIRAGRFSPSTIRVRILVPDTQVPWVLPCRTEDLTDDPEFRERAAGIRARSLAGIIDGVGELHALGLLAHASAQVRVHRLTPLFKLFVINGDEVFFGFYPIDEHAVTINGNRHDMYDLLGKDATLFHYGSANDDLMTGAQHVAQAKKWFESVWSCIARDRTDG